MISYFTIYLVITLRQEEGESTLCLKFIYVYNELNNTFI